MKGDVMPATNKSTERRPEGTWPINRVDDHIIFESGRKNVLVDTGSNISLGNQKTFSLLGKSVRLQPDIQGLTLERLSEFIHYRIDVLLGGDFLGLMPFTIDFSDNDLRFHDQPVRFQGKDLETELFAGVPLVEVSIADRPVTLVLDTGAKISFLDPSIIRDYPPVGKISDFSPFSGPFQTTRHEVPISIAGQDIMLQPGKTPKSLKEFFTRFNKANRLNIQGLLGNDLNYHFRVHFELGRSRIILGPHIQ
jgi:hypothetical protein